MNKVQSMRIVVFTLLLALLQACSNTPAVNQTTEPKTCYDYYRAGRLTEAKTLCSALAKHERTQTQVEGHYYLANIAERESDYLTAYRHYVQAHKRKPIYDADIQRNLSALQASLASLVDQRQYKQAFELSQELAVNGVAFAQMTLGDLYRKGQGVRANKDKALHWYSQASQAQQGGGQEASQAIKNWMRESFLQAIKAYQSKQYDTAFVAFEWLAKNGHKGARGYLADSYLYGRGVQKNTPQAANWYRKAANQGGAYEAFQLARLLQLGEGIEKDSKQAFRYYRQAAQADYQGAYVHVAMLYSRGDGVNLDYNKARYWYEKAIQVKGANISFYNLAYLYQLGLGGAQDLDKAQALYLLYQPQTDPILQQRLLDIQQMRQLSFKHPDSPVLFTQKLYGARRVSMQVALKVAGYKVERENIMYWADHYQVSKPSKNMPGAKDLYLYYSHTADTNPLGSQSDLLAQLEYVFGAQPRKHILKIKRWLVKQYGQPSAQYGRLNEGDMLYQWALDGVLVQLQRSGPEMELRLTYQVDDIYPMMLQEIKRYQEREELKKYQGTKHEL